MGGNRGSSKLIMEKNLAGEGGGGGGCGQEV
jgi:hypothetical protein